MDRLDPAWLDRQYDNRARIPEHPRIFERWAQASALAQEGLSRRLDIAYGSGPGETLDVYPAPAAGAPVLVFIHGGYWRSLDPSMFSHLARGMNAHGVTVAVSGYDLVPQVSIADIVAQTQAACLFLWKRFGKRIMVSGHSAGGHLAGCMVATDWKKLDAGAPADLVPAAYAISGLYDLSVLTHLAGNAEFKLTEASARAISSRRCWPRCSPARRAAARSRPTRWASRWRSGPSPSPSVSWPCCSSSACAHSRR